MQASRGMYHMPTIELAFSDADRAEADNGFSKLQAAARQVSKHISACLSYFGLTGRSRLSMNVIS